MKRPKHPPMALPDLHSPKHCARMKIFEDGVITMLINSSIRTTARFIVFVIDQLARCKNWEWNVILDWPARFYWLVLSNGKTAWVGFQCTCMVRFSAWYDGIQKMMINVNPPHTLECFLPLRFPLPVVPRPCFEGYLKHWPAQEDTRSIRSTRQRIKHRCCKLWHMICACRPLPSGRLWEDMVSNTNLVFQPANKKCKATQQD